MQQESELTEVGEQDVAGELSVGYDLRPVEVIRIPAGTATINYRVTDDTGGQWFAKVYRDRALLERERAAVELAEFARSGQLPVPSVRRTREGELIKDSGPLPMSVWEFVTDAETAEGGLVGRRWPEIGAMLGRLHRRLAEHAAATPTLRPAAGVYDLDQARARFERLITEYGERGRLDPFGAWAADAVEQRLALLDRVGVILAGLPELTVQIVHGDLASPNLLLRGDEVAAVIDFQPPTPHYLSWEIARIACDPRTVLLGDQWIAGLPELIDAYRDEHPAARPEDLSSLVSVGCAYTLASSYPLAEPLKTTGPVEESLQEYGRARHQAALVLLDRLDDVRELLLDRVR
jgi:Ser/Thr protein kinase RdoA (MazF antagonist)